MKILAFLTLSTLILFSCSKGSPINPGKNLSVTVSGTPAFTMDISTSADSINYTTLLDTTISQDTSYTFNFHAKVGNYLRVVARDLPEAYLGFKITSNNTIITNQPSHLNYGTIEMSYNHRIKN